VVEEEAKQQILFTHQQEVVEVEEMGQVQMGQQQVVKQMVVVYFQNYMMI
jgi:hypothetical protein